MLRHLQIVGTEEEMEATWKDAGGHALTLQLLGRFIVDAYPDRDICHFREVKFEEAGLERQGRSAFKVMIAYERWLRSAGRQHRVELALLRLTGLFDRPMTRSCLGVLREWTKPSWMQWLFSRRAQQIWRTFGPLTWVSDKELNMALKRLGDVDLLTATPEAIDAHPLIREYFARELREAQPEAYRAAHSRLFDHLCESTPQRPDTLEGLQPLYQAVAHGCLAGRHQQACDAVYTNRITRQEEKNVITKLGAVGADLAAVVAFFDEPWGKVSPNLPEVDRAWLLGQAAFRLQALGRLAEALQPMRAGLEMYVQQKNWRNAAIGASNLSDLEVPLGRLAEAAADARQAVALADCSGAAFQRIVNRTTAADTLHKSGERGEAGAVRLGRAHGAGTAAGIPPALLAARLPVLRLAAGTRRARSLAGTPPRHGRPAPEMARNGGYTVGMVAGPPPRPRRVSRWAPAGPGGPCRGLRGSRAACHGSPSHCYPKSMAPGHRPGPADAGPGRLGRDNPGASAAAAGAGPAARRRRRQRPPQRGDVSPPSQGPADCGAVPLRPRRAGRRPRPPR